MDILPQEQLEVHPEGRWGEGGGGWRRVGRVGEGGEGRGRVGEGGKRRGRVGYRIVE